jgi:hypothetical protein
MTERTTIFLRDETAREPVCAPELEEERDCVLAVASLASWLFLEPRVVLQIGLYWASQYCDYSVREDDYLASNVAALLSERPALSLRAIYGLAHSDSVIKKYALWLQFAGGELHAVPNEMLVMAQCSGVMHALEFLVSHSASVFLKSNAGGLRGELELGACRYDAVMAHFYEPSFQVMTALMLALYYLQQTGVAGSHDEPVVLDRLLRALHCDAEPTCLDPTAHDHTERVSTLHADLAQLRLALSPGHSIASAMESVHALWTEKASHVTELIPLRLKTLCDELF